MVPTFGNKISQSTMKYARLNHSEEDSATSEPRSSSPEEPDGKEPNVHGLMSSRHQRNKAASETATQSFIGLLMMSSTILLITRSFITHSTPKDTHQSVMPRTPYQFQMTAPSDSAQKPSNSSVTNPNGLAMVSKEKADLSDSQQPKMVKPKQNVVSISKVNLKTSREISGMKRRTSLSSSSQKTHLNSSRTPSSASWLSTHLGASTAKQWKPNIQNCRTPKLYNHKAFNLLNIE